MAKALAEGAHGGVDLLSKEDRVRDSELAEKSEPTNERTGDQLTAALQAVLKTSPGGWISKKQFIVTRGADMRDTEIIFDRYYWEQSLLVDMLPLHSTDPDRIANETHVREHREYAEKHGMKYLAVIGSATLGEIESALQ